jgi:DNA-binding transcriptional MerR regulator
MAMSIRANYVKVRDAAAILGGAPNTVRAWGAAGKLPEVRSPANGYRLYRRSDLEKFLQRIERMATRAAKRNK